VAAPLIIREPIKKSEQIPRFLGVQSSEGSENVDQKLHVQGLGNQHKEEH
jgi:hypothetical protein